MTHSSGAHKNHDCEVLPHPPSISPRMICRTAARRNRCGSGNGCNQILMFLSCSHSMQHIIAACASGCKFRFAHGSVRAGVAIHLSHPTLLMRVCLESVVDGHWQFANAVTFLCEKTAKRRQPCRRSDTSLKEKKVISFIATKIPEREIISSPSLAFDVGWKKLASYIQPHMRMMRNLSKTSWNAVLSCGAHQHGCCCYSIKFVRLESLSWRNGSSATSRTWHLHWLTYRTHVHDAQFIKTVMREFYFFSMSN